MADQDCIFCKIVEGNIPASVVYEDDRCIAFNDIEPQAPTHILVIPRVHIESLDTAGEDQKELIGHLMLTAAKVARDKGFSDAGYRVVANTNADGGQTVFHLHVHLLGGRVFAFPPG